jgi:hypothetical protein
MDEAICGQYKAYPQEKIRITSLQLDGMAIAGFFIRIAQRT